MTQFLVYVGADDNGRTDVILTGASDAESAIEQVASYLLCPRSICTATEVTE